MICKLFPQKGDLTMHKAKDIAILNMKVPRDVREQLLQWAADNVSSMNAELIRSVRDRMARQQRERAEAR
jgi:hypothetical protein